MTRSLIAILCLATLCLGQIQPQTPRVQAVLTGGQCDYSAFPGPVILTAWAEPTTAGGTRVQIWPFTSGRRSPGLTLVGVQRIDRPLDGIGSFVPGCRLLVDPLVIIAGNLVGEGFVVPHDFHAIPFGTRIEMQLIEMWRSRWASSGRATLEWTAGRIR